MQDYYTHPAKSGMQRENEAIEHQERGQNQGWQQPPRTNYEGQNLYVMQNVSSPAISRRACTEDAAQSLIFLRPEQIRAPHVPESAHPTRNAIIRLSESIKRYGVIEPLTVRPISENGYPYYELVSGERQYRAACLAGVQKLPCAVLAADDIRCTQLVVMERLRGERLNFFEQANAYRMLLQDYHLTQEEVARRMGVSQSTIANKLRLLRFSEEERTIILRTGLTERHARALLRLQNPAERLQMLQSVASDNLNVSQTETRIDTFLTKRVALVPKPVVTPMNAEPNGTLPRKFAIQDLTPLYNSIEKTLAIFRKTGAEAECVRQESEGSVEILIRIPRHA